LLGLTTGLKMFSAFNSVAAVNVDNGGLLETVRHLHFRL
jgi:hypothetical protein